ncbi:MAG: hypothetical protein ACFCVA_08635 [Gammaproteobacteria bacterium]
MILWGLGKAGRALVRRFAADWRIGADATSLERVFEPVGDPLDDLRALVAAVTELSLSRCPGGSFSIAMIVAPWERADPEPLHLVRETSRLLAELVPGNQSVILFILIPPVLATAIETDAVFRFFSSLEKLIGSLRFLDAAFVLQLPADAYRDVTEESAGIASLADLIGRVLKHRDLSEVVRRYGFDAVRSRRQVAGRNAVYATLGGQRLIYHRAQTLEYLEARLQHDIFFHGLADPETVSAATRADLEGRSRAFVEDQRVPLAREVDTVQPPLLPLPDDVPPPAVVAAARRSCNEMAAAVLARLAAQLHGVVRETETGFRSELDHVLAHGTTLAAGPIALDAADTAIGALLLDFAVCPLQAELTDAFATAVETFALGSPVPVSLSSGAASPQDAFPPVIAALRAIAEATEGPEALATRWFVAEWDAFAAHQGGPATHTVQAQQLLDEALDRFWAVAGDLHRHIAANEARQDALRCQLLEVYQRFPWWHRWLSKRRAFREQRDALLAQLADSAEDQRRQRQAYAHIRAFFLTVSNRCLWPYLIRTSAVDALRDAHDRVDHDLTLFWTAVQTPCEQRWRAAQSVPESDGLTETSIVIPALLDALYGRRVKPAPWPDMAAAALAFRPNPLIQGGAPAAVSYAACATLCDHLHAGPETLVDRLAHFTADRVAPVRFLDALEVIEASGETGARAFFSRVLAKTMVLPELASGMVPLVEEQGLLRRTQVVACTEAIAGRLRRNYPEHFATDDCVVVTADPTLIDITRFTFGFPAFVLHGLQGARQRVLAEGATVDADIWPQSLIS